MQQQRADPRSDVEFLVSLSMALFQWLVSLALIWAAFNQNLLSQVAHRYRLVCRTQLI